VRIDDVLIRQQQWLGGINSLEPVLQQPVVRRLLHHRTRARTAAAARALFDLICFTSILNTTISTTIYGLLFVCQCDSRAVIVSRGERHLGVGKLPAAMSDASRLAHLAQHLQITAPILPASVADAAAAGTYRPRIAAVCTTVRLVSPRCCRPITALPTLPLTLSC
jgi:hypothetical protein